MSKNHLKYNDWDKTTQIESLRTNKQHKLKVWGLIRMNYKYGSQFGQKLKGLISLGT
jgi:hypothetical protein